MDTTDEMLKNLPTFMKKTSDSNNRNFIKSFAGEYDELKLEIDNLELSVTISTATDTSLDDIAKLFNLNRYDNESDSDFRNRILLYWNNILSSGHEDGIKQIVARQLNYSPYLITIHLITYNYINISIKSINYDTTKLPGVSDKKNTFFSTSNKLYMMQTPTSSSTNIYILNKDTNIWESELTDFLIPKLDTVFSLIICSDNTQYLLGFYVDGSEVKTVEYIQENNQWIASSTFLSNYNDIISNGSAIDNTSAFSIFKYNNDTYLLSRVENNVVRCVKRVGNNWELADEFAIGLPSGITYPNRLSTYQIDNEWYLAVDADNIYKFNTTDLVWELTTDNISGSGVIYTFQKDRFILGFQKEISIASKSWSSAANMNSVRTALAGVGVQPATVSFGGFVTTTSNITEEYDSVVWANANNMVSAASDLAGAGTQSAGLAFGGYYSDAASEYDGNTWTSISSLANKRRGPAGAGSQTAGLCIGGTDGISKFSSIEKYDGSTWSFNSNLNYDRYSCAGCGVQNSALTFGGYDEVYLNSTEEFDGSAWSVSGNLSVVRLALAGCGSQTAALTFGGYNGSYLNVAEEYDGSSWTVVDSLGSGRQALGGTGTHFSGLNFGGKTGSVTFVATTEEYNIDSYDVYGWSVGGNLNTVKYALGGAGTQTAGLSFGGRDNSDYLNTTEEYDGSTWTSGGNLNNARYRLAGAGTQTAGLSFGGYPCVTEEYDGSSWTTENNLNTPRYGLAGCGTQTAGLSFGGRNGGTLYSRTEKYDGSSWSVSGSLNATRYGLAGCGTQTAGLSFGGYGSTYLSTTEEYDGASWTTTNNLNAIKFRLAGAGTQSAGLAFGGFNDAMVSATEKYDGISWAIDEDLNTARSSLAGNGTQTAGLSFGGTDGNILNVTEEYRITSLATKLIFYNSDTSAWEDDATNLDESLVNVDKEITSGVNYLVTKNTEYKQQSSFNDNDLSGEIISDSGIEWGLVLTDYSSLYAVSTTDTNNIIHVTYIDTSGDYITLSVNTETMVATSLSIQVDSSEKKDNTITDAEAGHGGAGYFAYGTAAKSTLELIGSNIYETMIVPYMADDGSDEYFGLVLKTIKYTNATPATYVSHVVTAIDSDNDDDASKYNVSEFVSYFKTGQINLVSVSLGETSDDNDESRRVYICNTVTTGATNTVNSTSVTNPSTNDCKGAGYSKIAVANGNWGVVAYSIDDDDDDDQPKDINFIVVKGTFSTSTMSSTSYSHVRHDNAIVKIVSKLGFIGYTLGTEWDNEDRWDLDFGYIDLFNNTVFNENVGFNSTGDRQEHTIDVISTPRGYEYQYDLQNSNGSYYLYRFKSLDVIDNTLTSITQWSTTNDVNSSNGYGYTSGTDLYRVYWDNIKLYLPYYSNSKIQYTLNYNVGAVDTAFFQAAVYINSTQTDTDTFFHKLLINGTEYPDNIWNTISATVVVEYIITHSTNIRLNNQDLDYSYFAVKY